MVPILAYLFGIPATDATSYSLFVIGCASSLSLTQYIRRKEWRLASGLLFLLPSAAGTFVARRIILPAIPELLFEAGGLVLTRNSLVMIALAGILVVAAKSMVKKAAVTPIRPPDKGIGLGTTLGFAFTAGLVMGFVGAGGGFMIVPALLLGAQLPMKQAVGTSLFIIMFNSLFGFGSDILAGHVIAWDFALKIAGVTTLGAFVGTLLAPKVAAATLKKVFAWVLMGIAAVILYEEIFRRLF